MIVALNSELPPRLRTDQALAFLGVTPHQLKRLRQRRKIRFYKLTGNSISYDSASLIAFLKTREVAPTGGAP